MLLLVTSPTIEPEAFSSCSVPAKDRRAASIGAVAGKNRVAWPDLGHRAGGGGCASAESLYRRG